MEVFYGNIFCCKRSEFYKIIDFLFDRNRKFLFYMYNKNMIGYLVRIL